MFVKTVVYGFLCMLLMFGTLQSLSNTTASVMPSHSKYQKGLNYSTGPPSEYLKYGPSKSVDNNYIFVPVFARPNQSSLL